MESLNSYLIILGYIIIINLVAIIVTINDKSKARKSKWRIPESTLLIISALGGSAAMLITMKKIRHKTKHTKFMIGIPIIIVLQALILGLIFYFLKLR